MAVLSHNKRKKSLDQVINRKANQNIRRTNQQDEKRIDPDRIARGVHCASRKLDDDPFHRLVHTHDNQEALPRYFSQRKRHSCESAQIKAIPQAAAR